MVVTPTLATLYVLPTGYIVLPKGAGLLQPEHPTHKYQPTSSCFLTMSKPFAFLSNTWDIL